MTTEERDQLITDSEQVRDETVNKANTATRVGTLFRNIVNFAYNLYGDIPEINENNFGIDGDGKTVLKSNYIPRTGVNAQFNTFAKGVYGSLFNPITDSIDIDVTGAIPMNKAIMFVSSATVPSIIQFAIDNVAVTDTEDINYSAIKIKSGTFLIGTSNVNELRFRYLNGNWIDIEIVSYENLLGIPLEDIVNGLIVYAPLNYVSANPTSYPNEVSNSITIDVISPESGVGSIAAPNGGLASVFGGGSSLRINANTAFDSITTEFYMAFWARPTTISSRGYVEGSDNFASVGFKVDTASGGAQARFWYGAADINNTTRRVTQNTAFEAGRWDFFEFTYDPVLGTQRLKIMRNRITESQSNAETGITLNMTGVNVSFQAGQETAYKNIIIANQIPSESVRNQLFELV
jgi:hypothetical protein